MGFDDLIPFIIFAVYIGFAALKAVLKKKKKLQQSKQPLQPSEQLSEKPAKKAGFGFSKIIKTIKTELEKAVNEAKLKGEQAGVATKRNIWEELRGGSKETNLEDRLADRNFEDANKISVENIVRQTPDSDETVLDRVEQSTEPIDDTSQVSESQDAYSQKPQPFALKKRKQNKGLNLSVAKMREAVILSEILAKPVGLKE